MGCRWAVAVDWKKLSLLCGDGSLLTAPSA